MTNCIKPIGRVKVGNRYADVACKMRNCPICSQVLRNQLMDRVKSFYGDQTPYFNTVTLKYGDTGNIMDYWKKLTKRLKYYYPHLLIFWTKEYTKRGMAHLHFLTSQTLDGSWLSRTWLEITGSSFIVKCGNTTGEIRNPAAYMLKYMTKAHNNIDLYDKGERLYGFLGAKSPPVIHPEFDDDDQALEFELDQHFNESSKYWLTWYNEMQRWIGPAFISFVNYRTISPLDRMRADIEKLNSEYENRDAMFTKVEHHEESDTTNKLRWERWKKNMAAKTGGISDTPDQLRYPDSLR